MGNVVAVHQPNFMPWLGYFYKIYESNIFVFLDDVQMQRGSASYTNRVDILAGGVKIHLTAPVVRSLGVLNIDQTIFSENKWKKKMVSNLQGNYARSPYFKQNKDFIFDLIHYSSDNLSDYNINFITSIANELSLHNNFIRSSEFNISTSSTERLIELVKNANGSIYLSGSGGKNYQNDNLYENSGIELRYSKLPDFSYQQVKAESFVSGLSIVDAIFNIGFDNLRDQIFIPK